MLHDGIGATRGAEPIARRLVEQIGAEVADVTVLEHNVNGRPGLVLRQHDTTAAVLAFDVAGDRVTHIWAIRNPDKLRAGTAD